MRIASIVVQKLTGVYETTLANAARHTIVTINIQTLGPLIDIIIKQRYLKHYVFQVHLNESHNKAL